MTTRNDGRVQMTVRLDLNLRNWLKQQAKRERRSMGNTILCLLERYKAEIEAKG